ncbi:MAG: peroxiredoxin [Pirellulaceae bacterium]|jgi:peroxiredoxin
MQILGVSYDSVAILEKFSTKQNLSFDLLSDETSATIKDYHLNFKKGLAAPATIVIDQEGIVHAKLRHESYRDRHTNEELLKVAKALSK